MARSPRWAGSRAERFGAVDVNTGVADANVNIPFANKRDGTLRVAHFDISPDGTKLVATGTFLTAGGQDRAQIAMLDLTTTPVSVSSWESDALKPNCNPKFDTYIRDVEFSPDGSYFVLGNTGAYTGGPAAGVLCDSVTKWDANATGPGQKPHLGGLHRRRQHHLRRRHRNRDLRGRPPALDEQPQRQ